MQLLFGLIAIIIVLIVENRKKKDDNNQKINNEVNFCPKCGIRLKEPNSNFCHSCGSNLHGKRVNAKKNIPVEKIKKKEKKSDKEIKNNFILITGAILIVLAAIIFLTSTWYITHNVIKTGVIIFMLAVFLIISYIAKKYFNLEQTSKTFYYIALAYIPLVLLSISMFKLFGNYLSLYGNGRYIYLTLSSILVALIYYINAQRNKSKVIFSFSIIFQLISVIFFTLIFTNNVSVIFSTLFCYNILISILYLQNKIINDLKTHLILSTTLFISISVVLILYNLFNIILSNINIFDFISNILLFINMYLVLIKILKKENIYNYLYPLVIVSIFNNLGYLFNISIIRQLIIIISFVFISFYNLVKENKINLITHLEIIGILSIFNFIWLFNDKLLDGYIIYSIVTFINIMSYIHNKKYRNFLSYILSIGIIIISLSVAINFDFSPLVIGFVSLLLILINMLYEKMQSHLIKSFKWVGVVTLSLVTLITFKGSISSLILFIIVVASTFIYGNKNNDNFYKIFSYIYLNVLLFNFFDLMGITYKGYIIPLTTLIITYKEILDCKLTNKVSGIYLIISFIASNISLICLFDLTSFIAIIITNLIFVWGVIENKRNINYLYIPFLGVIPHIYLSASLSFNDFNVMRILSIIILIILLMFIYKKKNNFYIIMLYIYTLFHIIGLEQNKYIGILLLILGTIICYSIKNNKVKDIYKALIYIFGLILYKFILKDLGINNITALSIGIYIVLLVLLTRTIFKKYFTSYKIWEYIMCSLINLISICACFNSSDRLLYILLLVVIVIVSYLLKFGPVFIVCLISIILNTILLMGSVPWWIYILLIGILLIGVAIYNEVKDKNKNQKNSIKEYLDL